MGIVTIAYNRNLFVVFLVEQWTFIIQSTAAGLSPLYTPCVEFLTFNFYFLLCQSLSPFFFMVTFFSWCVKCSVVACECLSIAFNSHSNYAALIRFTQSWNIPTTIPIFCTYIKHRNHFPYKRAYFLVDREHFSVSLTHWLDLVLPFSEPTGCHITFDTQQNLILIPDACSPLSTNRIFRIK